MLRDRLVQLRREKELLELQESLREEMEDIIKDYDLEGKKVIKKNVDQSKTPNSTPIFVLTPET